MKKILKITIAIAILTLLLLSGITHAAALDTINVEVSKTTVRPGEEVTVTVQFGQNLGAYTIDVSYDDNIFEYVGVEGGTENDTGDKVKVVYHDTTGGTNPRTNMSVTFKAKENITTSNPTEFTITGDGLANADASVTYEDITTPIVKNVTVEPQYVDYTLKLENAGEIVKEQEKQMTLSYSSPMGRYYEHARLIAEATKPTGATVQLLATDDASLEHDIIQSGWGDAQGFKIGGKDVSQVLQVRGVFSQAGDYTITLKLIDRDNSDQVISQQAFQFKVVESATQVTPPTDTGITPPTETTPPVADTENLPKEEVAEPEKTPTVLPKTGINMYIPIMALLIVLISCYVIFNKRK